MPHEHTSEPRRGDTVAASCRPKWQAPEFSTLGASETETTTIKWFTPDIHIVTSDYGTPPS